MTRDLDAVRATLAPDGKIKAALNLSNSLLNQGQDATGEWQGIAPDLARAIASALGVRVDFVPYTTPSMVMEAFEPREWTIAMIAADPARSGRVAFSAPYAQIEAAYMVPPGSPVQDIHDVDQPGRRIAAFEGSAFGIWLERNLRHAELVGCTSFGDAFTRLKSGEVHVLASLVPKLREDLQAWPGCRVLDGLFMTVQQAVACSSTSLESLAFLSDFVEEAIRRGQVASWIRHHRANGLRASGSSEVTSGSEFVG